MHWKLQNEVKRTCWKDRGSLGQLMKRWIRTVIRSSKQAFMLKSWREEELNVFNIKEIPIKIFLIIKNISTQLISSLLFVFLLFVSVFQFTLILFNNCVYSFKYNINTKNFVTCIGPTDVFILTCNRTIVYCLQHRIHAQRYKHYITLCT